MQNERFFFLVGLSAANGSWGHCRRTTTTVWERVCVWALVCVSREGYKWGLRCGRCKRRGKRSVTCSAVSRSAPCEFAHPFGGGNATDTVAAVYLNIVKTHALCYTRLCTPFLHHHIFIPGDNKHHHPPRGAYVYQVSSPSLQAELQRRRRESVHKRERTRTPGHCWCRSSIAKSPQTAVGKGINGIFETGAFPKFSNDTVFQTILIADGIYGQIVVVSHHYLILTITETLILIRLHIIIIWLTTIKILWW